MATQTERREAMVKMDKVIIYTDGACSGNPGPGGYAALLLCGDRERVITGRAARSTNNVMELSAVRDAIKILRKPCEVTVWTDSRDLVGWMQERWRRRNPRIANLCAEIEDLTQRGGHQVHYQKLPAHSGDPFNERVDKLARAAIPQMYKQEQFA